MDGRLSRAQDKRQVLTKDCPENRGGSQKMLEGVKSRGLGVRVLLVMAAMVLAMFAANALYNAPSPLGTKKAEASHIAAWGKIQGTVYYKYANGSRTLARGAYVQVWRPNSDGSWTILCPLMTTNSNGTFACSNVGAHHTYEVRARAEAGWDARTGVFSVAPSQVVNLRIYLT
jgi:hypothetical protein